MAAASNRREGLAFAAVVVDPQLGGSLGRDCCLALVGCNEAIRRPWRDPEHDLACRVRFPAVGAGVIVLMAGSDRRRVSPRWDCPCLDGFGDGPCSGGDARCRTPKVGVHSDDRGRRTVDRETPALLITLEAEQ